MMMTTAAVVRRRVGGAVCRLYSANADISDKLAILDCSLKLVHKCGWTQETIHTAVQELGLPTAAYTVVDRGVYDLVEHFTNRRRDYVISHVRQLPSMVAGSDKPIDRVHAALDAHISFVQPYLKSWPSALAIMAEPALWTSTSSSLLGIADDMCLLEDVKAFRIDWYSERILAVYLFASTEVYMLGDSSNDLSDTRYREHIGACVVLAIASHLPLSHHDALLLVETSPLGMWLSTGT